MEADKDIMNDHDVTEPVEQEAPKKRGRPAKVSAETQKPKAEPTEDKLFLFRLLKGTNFPAVRDDHGNEVVPKKLISPMKVVPYKQVISDVTNDPELDKDRLPVVKEMGQPRAPENGEFGENSKIKKGSFVMVDKEWAKRFTDLEIAKPIHRYD